MDRESLKNLLIKHEGVKLHPYKDTLGRTTIGIGRNLDNVGISLTEAMYLLDNDLANVVAGCRNQLPWFNDLSNNRQNVVASMVFNLGMRGFLEFQKAIANIAVGQWSDAANELRNSHWATQVGDRAEELASMMEVG